MPGRSCTPSTICWGTQSREQLENFPRLRRDAELPSRTKDRIPVDFSTGSVGLRRRGHRLCSLVQDYLLAHGLMRRKKRAGWSR
jgi:pyruvate dehydrogenase E1 component